MLVGSLFVPFNAKADFFSNLFGDLASASTNPVVQDSTEVNSQNIGLLEANVSSATVIQDKKDKNNKNNTNTIDKNKDINIVSDSALLPPTGPSGVSDGTDNGDISSDQISVYVVRKGDSLAKIAEMFGVTSNTILWANDMKKGDKLVENDVLLILPVSGVKHTVLKGQTLKGIANKYKVDVSDIAGFNGIAENAQLAVGDELIIPDGVISDDGGGKSTSQTSPKEKDYYTKYPLQNLGGYFINPVPEYKKITQRLHAQGGVDLAAPTGTPIIAAASGKVLLARMGWNGAFGNMVIINHSNGAQTLYAHMSKLGTNTGDQVSQGEIIGYVGSTGRSTGPHLHYEVHGARNNALELPTFNNK